MMPLGYRWIVQLGVDVSHREGRAVLHVSGDLDLATAPAFRQAIVGAVAAGDRRLIVDLGATDHLDSVGLGLLLGARKRAVAHGGDLVVVCPEPRLRRVLELTELTRIVPVVERLADALDADERPSPASTRE